MFIASRRLASVSDSNASRRSPFNDGLVKVLKDYVGVIDGSSLLNSIRYLLIVDADRILQYSDVRGTGHDGGDFLLVRRN